MKDFKAHTYSYYFDPSAFSCQWMKLQLKCWNSEISADQTTEMLSFSLNLAIFDTVLPKLTKVSWYFSISVAISVMTKSRWIGLFCPNFHCKLNLLNCFNLKTPPHGRQKWMVEGKNRLGFTKVEFEVNKNDFNDAYLLSHLPCLLPRSIF